MTHEPPPIGADWLTAETTQPPDQTADRPTLPPDESAAPADVPVGTKEIPLTTASENTAPTRAEQLPSAPPNKPAAPPATKTPAPDSTGLSPGDAFGYGVLLGVVVVFLIGLVVVLVRENHWQEKESQWKKDAEVRQKK